METEFGATLPNFGLQLNLKLWSFWRNLWNPKFYESIKTSSCKICTVFGGMLLECKNPVIGHYLNWAWLSSHLTQALILIAFRGPQVLHKNPSWKQHSRFYPKEKSRPQLKNNVHAKIKNQITLVRTGDWKFSGWRLKNCTTCFHQITKKIS